MFWLTKALFDKYAPVFSDKVNWNAYKSAGREARKSEIIKIKSRLKAKHPAYHNDLCGALNIILIAAKSRKIKKYMMDQTQKKGPVRSRFGHDILKKVSGDGQPNEPTNIAAWFCIHEEDMPNEANKIKQFALAEEQRYYNWVWYNITPPTKIVDENTTLTDFEDALKEIFRREKDDKRFPVRASRLTETKTFVRYCVSTAKDPIETFLAQNGRIDRGNDPTANTFLIDHYFNSDIIRIAFPEVIESSRAASIFAEVVLGSKITEEEPKVFLNAMRRFASEKDCERLLEKARKISPEIKNIGLKAIRFTVAEDIKTAELRRNLKESKKRVADGLKPLPRLRCEVFENDNIFESLRRNFTETARRKELMDVFELIFKIDLYETSAQQYLSEEMKSEAVPTKSYLLTVTSRNLRFTPRLQEVENRKHQRILRDIQNSLELTNELATKVIKEAQS